MPRQVTGHLPTTTPRIIPQAVPQDRLQQQMTETELRGTVTMFTMHTLTNLSVPQQRSQCEQVLKITPLSAITLLNSPFSDFTLKD